MAEAVTNSNRTPEANPHLQMELRRGAANRDASCPAATDVMPVPATQNRYMTNPAYSRCVLSVVTGLSAASPCSLP